jgi:hypothetical protein
LDPRRARPALRPDRHHLAAVGTDEADELALLELIEHRLAAGRGEHRLQQDHGLASDGRRVTDRGERHRVGVDVEVVARREVGGASPGEDGERCAWLAELRQLLQSELGLQGAVGELRERR